MSRTPAVFLLAALLAAPATRCSAADRVVFLRSGRAEMTLYIAGLQGRGDLHLRAPALGEIFVMRFDGTHVEQLTDNQWEDGGPAWQPHAPTSATLIAPAH